VYLIWQKLVHLKTNKTIPVCFHLLSVNNVVLN